MSKPDLKALKKRFGRDLGTTLTQLIELAFTRSPENPRTAFAPLFDLPWIDNAVEYDPRILMSPNRIEGVVPFAHEEDSSAWIGLYFSSSKASADSAPVVIHFSKGCGHDNDVDEALVQDFGFKSSDDVEHAEEMVAHQVVASSLSEYLSIVASTAQSVFCRHSTENDFATSADATSVDTARSLASIPNVATDVSPLSIVGKAPKLKFKWALSEAQVNAANLGKLQAAALHTIDATLKRPNGALATRFKTTWSGAKATIEFRVTPHGRALPEADLVRELTEALVQANGKLKGVSVGSFSCGATFSGGTVFSVSA